MQLNTKSFSRYLYCDNFEIGNIIFFNENGIVCNSKKSFFEKFDLSQFYLGDIKLKRKIDFSCKDNFIISNKKDYSWEDTKYTLYINTKNIELKYLGKVANENIFGYVYSKWDLCGKQFEIFEYSLLDDRNKIFEQVKDITKKLYETFYYRNEISNEDLLNYFKEIKSLNNKIIKETEKIKNYKTED